MDSVVGLAASFALLVVAAFATMSEAAIARISRVKAHHLAQQHKKGGGLLGRISEDPAPYMNVVVLTRVLALIAATVIATSVAAARWNGAGAAAAVAVMTILAYAVAEIVPRIYSVQHTETAALICAGPVFVLGKLLGPVAKGLVFLANAVMVPLPGRPLPKGPFATEEEMRDGDDDDEEGIEEEERELIDSIFQFGDTVVREVMVPRPDMVIIPTTASWEEALETSLKAGYSRIPVYEGDSDNIVGVVYAKDLMRAVHEATESGKAAEVSRQPMYVPEQKKVAELLREMQQHHVHMAIVVDEYGGTAGLATIEDLIEEIVGEIVDEYDQEEPLVEPIDDDTIRVDAKMPIDEVNELLDADLPHEEWDTVGGLVFDLTGRVPVQGETVRYDSIEFTTERVTGRRIQKVVITKLHETPEVVSE
ncbi:MAG: HlyC/CorC family transporter [Actinobacteria bacterium]|nr:HlyC/CorC family transporter [Actinomycetota bacterium]